MSKKRNSLSDLKGAGRLAIDTVNGVIDIVESVHYNISSLGGLLARNRKQRTSGITGMVYKNIRTITNFAGAGFDALLAKLPPIIGEKEPTPEQEAILSALNGVIGDHLEKTNNALAIRMKLRQGGKPIDKSIWQNEKSSKFLLMIHGSCMNDLQWNRKNHNHGTALASEFGYQPIYLHYNSGKHISENGRELSVLLESFFEIMSNENQLIIMAHSMGGLVARSAFYYAKQMKFDWPRRLKKIIFLGTPHHGAPLEQTGNWVDNMLESNPFSAPISSVGKIRSAGITDLRYGNILDNDWNKRDRFDPIGDQRTPVPLPDNIECFTLAAIIADKPNKIGDDIVGDGLVPLYSALGKHNKPEFHLKFKAKNQQIVRNLKHLDLLNNTEVYNKLKTWLDPYSSNH
jgi:pimeloyl-ACP methyl ester carboxylesterase